MSLPATLAFAIDIILRSHPDLGPIEVCRELRHRNWEVDEDDVTAFLERRQSVSEPTAEPVLSRGQGRDRPPPTTHDLPGVDLRILPADLGEAVRKFIGVERTDESRRTLPTSESFRLSAEQMMEALTAEMGAVAEGATDRRVKLRSGQLLGVNANGYTARWEADGDPTAQEGVTVKLAFASGAVDAEIIQTAGASITLFVAGRPSRPVSDAEMILDASFLLDLRRKYLGRILSGESLVDQTASLAFMTASDFIEPISWSSEGRLNEDQDAFVGQALAGGVTWLWGPPGTGKTTTLAHLLRELRRRRLRTLFVSNTNTAVDTALLKLLDMDESAGEIVRIGRPSAEDLVDHPAGPVLVDTIAASRGLDVGVHLAQCRRDIAEARTANNLLVAIQRDLVGARDRGWFGTPDDDIFMLRQRFDDEDIAGQRDHLEAELGRLTERRKSLEALLDLVRGEIVDRARLVFATVHQTYLRALAGQRFDVVVIDEASMVSGDLVALAAGLGAGHTILAGDFRQLGPIATSTSAAATRWLRSSAFQLAGIDALVASGSTPANLIALTVQHRMRPKIQRLISTTFYSEIGLRAGPSIAARPPGMHTPMHDELVLVDTSSLRPWMAKRGGRHSRLNVMHAQVVDAIADTVAPHRSFGAVSPFAPQARLLHSLIDSRESHAASTVHRFQGGERDVMVWDMTEGRAGARPVNRWFDATRADQEGARLLNVALSRARDQLFVVADLDRVRSGCRDTSSVRRVLDLMTDGGTVLDAVELFDAASERTRLLRAEQRHPLLNALARDDEPWMVLWCSHPPREIPPDIELAIAKAVHAGRSIYVRSGVPDRPQHFDSLLMLQRLGCQVQIVRPAWENLVLTPSGVITSSVNLVNITGRQSWLETRNVVFSGTVLRMVSRRGDANPAKDESDKRCVSGHPVLLDQGHPERDFRGRCLWCHGDITANVRSGRSRAKTAARKVPRCHSCGQDFGVSGWCEC